MHPLLAEARRLGVTVHTASLPRPYLGFYDQNAAKVYTHINLTANMRAIVLAHELGHAYHGHHCDSTANEIEADEYAAQLLITVRDYARAEQVSTDPDHIADALGVTAELVQAFRRILHTWPNSRHLQTA